MIDIIYPIYPAGRIANLSKIGSCTVQRAFAHYCMATENRFDSPDVVMHRASKERSRGGKNPMTRPLQNNRDKIWDLCCNQIIYLHFFPC